MSRISRVLYRLFGVDGPVGDFGAFGSRAEGSPVYTKDPAVIQGLDAWATGWKNALLSGESKPFLEDWNALFLVMSRAICYLMQEGVPEWEVNTEYHQNSIVKKPGTFELYASLVNNNTGNTLPTQTDDVNWKFLFPVRTSQLLGTLTDAQLDAIAAAKITGTVADSQIASMAASKLLGLIQDAQIQSLAFTKLTGLLQTSQMAANAVSQYASSGNNVGPSAEGSALVATASITSTGGPILVCASFRGFSLSTVPYISLARSDGGSVVGEEIKLGGGSDWQTRTPMMIDVPAAGVQTYNLKQSGFSGATGNIRLIELKK